MSEYDGLRQRVLERIRLGHAPEEVADRERRLERFRFDGTDILFDLVRHWPIWEGGGPASASSACILIRQTYRASRSAASVELVDEVAEGTSARDLAAVVGTGPYDLASVLDSEIAALDSEDEVEAWATSHCEEALFVERKMFSELPRLPGDIHLADGFVEHWKRFGEQYVEEWTETFVVEAMGIWEQAHDDD